MKLNGVKNVECMCVNAQHFSRNMLGSQTWRAQAGGHRYKFSAVLVDPPRAGLDRFTCSKVSGKFAHLCNCTYNYRKPSGCILGRRWQITLTSCTSRATPRRWSVICCRCDSQPHSSRHARQSVEIMRPGNAHRIAQINMCARNSWRVHTLWQDLHSLIISRTPSTLSVGRYLCDGNHLMREPNHKPATLRIMRL